jgi:hypothetical protein
VDRMVVWPVEEHSSVPDTSVHFCIEVTFGFGRM